MDDYIERQEALSAVCNGCNIEFDDQPCEPSDCYIRKKLMEVASACVAPVQSGKWEWFEDWNPSTTDHPAECEDCGWRCGKCKTALADVVGGYWDDPDDEPKLKFCPNCGVMMD